MRIEARRRPRARAEVRALRAWRADTWERKVTSTPVDSSLDPEEAALCARARDGDMHAFGILVEKHSSAIFAHVYHVVRDRHEAEDVTQEVFARALRGIGRFDPARPFRNWLYRIATNTALNVLRSRRRRGVGVPLEENEGRCRLASGPAAGPAELAERGELAAHLDAAVAQLPPRTGMLVRLHYTEGLSIREAAESVGMTEGAAKTALCRARRQLRQIMTEGHEL